jgi:hypothetical protein
MNRIVIFMSCTCIVMHSLFCQLPNCNLFTQHVISLWRDTSSELWTPVHSFTFIIPSTANTVYFPQVLFYFTANKYRFPYYTSNPLLSANQCDWQPHCKLRKSSLVVLCEGSTLPIIDVQKNILPWSSLGIFMFIYLAGIGLFLILSHGVIFWVLLSSWWTSICHRVA